MPDNIQHRDGLDRRLPPLRLFGLAETRRLEHRLREQRRGLHLDWRERSELLTAFDGQVNARSLDDAQVHDILGFDPDALQNGSMATPLLLDAFARLLRQPR